MKTYLMRNAEYRRFHVWMEARLERTYAVWAGIEGVTEVQMTPETLHAWERTK